MTASVVILMATGVAVITTPIIAWAAAAVFASGSSRATSEQAVAPGGRPAVTASPAIIMVTIPVTIPISSVAVITRAKEVVSL